MKIGLLAVLAAALIAAPSAGAWTWPADGGVLRPFVFGENPYLGGQHRGIDVGGAAGSTVRAPVGGRVAFAGTVPSGKTVTIQTADGYSVTLVQLGSIGVGQGLVVNEGDPVGTIGPSGVAEHAEPYVHLGVRVTTDPQGYVDPLLLLPPKPASVSAGPPATGPAPAPVSPPSVLPPAVSLPPVAPPPTGSVPAPAAPVAGLPPAPPPLPVPGATTSTGTAPASAPVVAPSPSPPAAAQPASPPAPPVATVPAAPAATAPSPAASPAAVPSPGVPVQPSPPAVPSTPVALPAATAATSAASPAASTGRSLPAPPPVGESAPLALASPVAQPVSPVPAPLIDPQLPLAEDAVPAAAATPSPAAGSGESEPVEEAVAPAVVAAVPALAAVVAETAALAPATGPAASGVEPSPTEPEGGVVAPAGESVDEVTGPGSPLLISISERTAHRGMGGRQADPVGRSPRSVADRAVEGSGVPDGMTIPLQAKARALPAGRTGAPASVWAEGRRRNTGRTRSIESGHVARTLRARDSMASTGATSVSDAGTKQAQGVIWLVAGLGGLLAASGIVRGRRRRYARSCVRGTPALAPEEPTPVVPADDSLSGVGVWDLDALLRDLQRGDRLPQRRADIGGSGRPARRPGPCRPGPGALVGPHARHVRMLGAGSSAPSRGRNRSLV
ncbi:MAG: M23 family metallopeptidase [Actinobacteria bacterium]|nr:M23 family metallopeptidase [Actinomycetota bacterium]